MQRLNAFIQSIHWWELVPSGLNGMKTLITNGGGADTTATYVAAAAVPNGSLLIAYIPPDHNGSITVDMSVLKKSVHASWFDPTNGTYTAITDPQLTNHNPYTFTPPGKNSKGQQDWVLKLVATD